MSSTSGDNAPKPPGRRSIPSCQVKGCEIPFPEGISYHRRYKICLHHASLPQLVVDSHVVRWCQQCGKFHDIAEFDGIRKTCRTKLAIHNAQRKAARTRRKRRPSPSEDAEHGPGRRGAQPYLDDEPFAPRPPPDAEGRDSAGPGLLPLGPPPGQGGPLDGIDLGALLGSFGVDPGAAGAAGRYDGGGAGLMAVAAGLKQAAWDAIKRKNAQALPQGQHGAGAAFPSAFTATAGPGALAAAHPGGWPTHAAPPPGPPPPYPSHSASMLSSQMAAPAAAIAPAAAPAPAPSSDDVHDISMRLFGVPPSALPQRVVDSLIQVLQAKDGTQR